MDLPTYTNIWRIEKRLYKLYDLRLPMPLPIVWIGVFAGVLAPWSLLLWLVGIGFEAPWHVLYLVPPGIVTWLSTRPVIESKRLTELLQSQLRYMGEPRSWCRLIPTAEPESVTFSGRVWRAAPAPVRVKAKAKAGAHKRRAVPAAVKARQVRPAVAAAAAAATHAPVAPPATATHAPVAPPATARPAWGGATGRRQGVAPALPSADVESPFPPDTPVRHAEPARVADEIAVAAPAAGVATPDDGLAVEGAALPHIGEVSETGAPVAQDDDTHVDATHGPGKHTEGRAGDGFAAQAGDGSEVRAGGGRAGDGSEAQAGVSPVRWGSRIEPGPAETPAQTPVAPAKPIGAEALRRLRRLAATADAPDQPSRPEPAPTQTSVTRAATARHESKAPRPQAARPELEVTPDAAAPVTAAARAEENQAEENQAEESQAEGVPVVEAMLPELPPAQETTADKPDPAEHGTGRHSADKKGTAKQSTDKQSAGERGAGRQGADKQGTGERGAGRQGTDEQDAAKHGADEQVEDQARDQHRKGQPPLTTAVVFQGQVRPTIPSIVPGSRPPQPPAQSGRQAQSPPPMKPSTKPSMKSPVTPPVTPAESRPNPQPTPAAQSAPPLNIRAVQAPTTPGGAVPGRRDEPRVRRVESVVGRDSSGGWRRLAQVVVGGGGSRTDGSEIDEARTRAVFGGGRRIVVLGCTGGAGQSTTALMLGHTLAQYRDDRVLAVDASTGGSTLTSRIKAESPETLTSLLSGLDQVNGYLGMRAFTTRTGSGLEVVAADTDSGAEQRLADRTLYSDHRLGQAMHLFDHHYKLTVLDPAPSLAARVLPYADQLVLVVPASEDAAEAVAMTFEWLDGHGCADLRRRAVMVVNGVSRRSMVDVEQAEAVARGRCRAIVRVPWEDDLAQSRTEPVEPEQLRQAGRRAYLALAGVVIAGFASAQSTRSSEEELAQ
ncbi:TcpE family conjugal transfer membrane protein [Nonomuraea sp. NPDC003804]|uniref:TcpE family conjugal transfer membrane protein n=1 Tax=Nonomuraea sp. NPDC003804 TaxID=3154547 RepID=UPI00339F145C